MDSRTKGKSTKEPKSDPVRQRAFAAAEKLKAWRESNNLSYRQAQAVMSSRHFPVSITTLQNWEESLNFRNEKKDRLKFRQPPSPLFTEMLSAFLESHPKITDPPVFARKPLSPKELETMREMREKGETYAEIAKEFKSKGIPITESGVWRRLNKKPS
jgi:hypothetical protein